MQRIEPTLQFSIGGLAWAKVTSKAPRRLSVRMKVPAMEGGTWRTEGSQRKACRALFNEVLARYRGASLLRCQGLPGTAEKDNFVSKASF